MGLASCASKALAFSKATTTIRKPLSGRLLKMASTARATSCNLIPPPRSTATLNVSSHLLPCGRMTRLDVQVSMSEAGLGQLDDCASPLW